MKIRTTCLALLLVVGCSENERTRPEPGDDAGVGGDGAGEGEGEADGDGDGQGGDDGGDGDEDVDGGEGEGEAGADEGAGDGDGGEGEGEAGGDDGGDGAGEGEGEAGDGGDDGGGEGEGEGEGEPDGPGACDNAADRRILGGQDVGGELLQCTLQCLAAPQDGCVATCVALATGLSPECARCLQPAEECRNENCLEACIPDRSAQPCKDCWDRACSEAFLECSGLEEVPEPRDGPNLAAACLNEDDQEVMGADPPPALRRTAQACAGECFGEPEGCGPRCISNGSGLSFACATCFDFANSCPFRRCFQQCLADPNAAPCQACLQNECLPEFQVCSGLDELPEDPEVPLPPAPEDACVGDADAAALDGADMPAVTGQCAFDCIGGPPECGLDCIADGAGLTDDCADCFARRQACQGANCWAACLGGDAACVACMDQQCEPAFEACAGIEFPEPPGGGQEGEGEGEADGGEVAPPEDACIGEADLAIANGPLNLWDQMGQCGLQCILQPPECLKDCVVAEAALSDKCAQCYANAQACKAAECFGECIGQAPDVPECAACMDQSCWPAFEDCAGYAFGDPPDN